MFQIISLLLGLCLTIVSAWLKDLDNLFIFVLIAILLMVFLDGKKIRRQSQGIRLNTMSLQQKNVISVILLLAWSAILFIPALQFPTDVVESLQNQGMSVPFYREISWWNTWFAPVVFLVLWGITWLLAALNKPTKQE